ncbi:MAG: hypothetical protein HY852_06545 [Bradyrhizobium sp.]|uniref:hypothetical protein n=1 Tax=Bradyrhizobium sp. TaxID=376 RepID=UPI0025C043BB|nr:hypothetical protein [Bradyrhizobium sp.]MBI5261461.1 hypothetical protein [Bradyrhizobium sp.]
MENPAAGRRPPRITLALSIALSLSALWIAAVEIPMAQWPSPAMVFVLPVLAPLFLGCSLWSTFVLTRWRRHGPAVAVPFLVCATTLALLLWTPFTQIWLQVDFWRYREARERVVAQVAAGELKPNVSYNPTLIALERGAPALSAGNEIVVADSADGTYVLFLTSRGIQHRFSGFLHVPRGADASDFFEFGHKPPRLFVRYDTDWYFVAN